MSEANTLRFMGPIEAFTTGWRKSFTYSGRAARVEYWWFALLTSVVYVVLIGIAAFELHRFETGFFLGLTIIYGIAQTFPFLSITIRRLRDAGKDWVWIFINFIPFIGGFWFLYLLIQPSILA